MSVYFEDQEGGVPEAPKHADAQREVQTPLLLQEMQSAEEAFGLPPARRHSQQAAVAVLLVIGAVGCIFAMRQFGLGPATSLAGINLDYKPETSSSGSSAKQVLADLERSRKAVQVPANFIKHDPFELMDESAIEDPTLDTGALTAAENARRAEEARLARERREQEVNAAFEKLTLQSVMEGTVPVARISDEIVKVGMFVGGHFLVTSIEGREVRLNADGREFVLSLESPRTDRGSGRPKGSR